MVLNGPKMSPHGLQDLQGPGLSLALPQGGALRSLTATGTQCTAAEGSLRILAGSVNKATTVKAEPLEVLLADFQRWGPFLGVLVIGAYYFGVSL